MNQVALPAFVFDGVIDVSHHNGAIVTPVDRSIWVGTVAELNAWYAAGAAPALAPTAASAG